MRAWPLLLVLLAGCSSKPSLAEEVVVEDGGERGAIPGVLMEIEGPRWFDQPMHFRLNGPPGNWRLDVDGDGRSDHDGSGLPAVVNHTYNQVGVFKVGLWTANSANASAFEVVRIEGPDVIDVERSMRLISHFLKETTSYRDCVGLLADQDELDCMVVPVPDLPAGLRYNMTGSPPPWASFLTECSVQAVELLLDHGGQYGPVPDGTGCIVVWGFGANFATLRLRVGPPGVV